MIVGLQISAIIFSLVMVYFATIHYKKGTINGVEIFSWSIIWVLTIVIVVFPDMLRVFARTFLFARLFDMMVFGGFVLVIILSANAYITTKNNEKKLEELIRKDALANIGREKEKVKDAKKAS